VEPLVSLLVSIQILEFAITAVFRVVSANVDSCGTETGVSRLAIADEPAAQIKAQIEVQATHSSNDSFEVNFFPWWIWLDIPASPETKLVVCLSNVHELKERKTQAARISINSNPFGSVILDSFNDSTHVITDVFFVFL